MLAASQLQIIAISYFHDFCYEFIKYNLQTCSKLHDYEKDHFYFICIALIINSFLQKRGQ
jgi:hypothetical protein